MIFPIFRNLQKCCLLRLSGRFCPVCRAEFDSAHEIGATAPFSRPRKRCGHSIFLIAGGGRPEDGGRCPWVQDPGSNPVLTPPTRCFARCLPNAFPARPAAAIMHAARRDAGGPWTGGGGRGARPAPYFGCATVTSAGRSTRSAIV
ncbi:hypothetical protein F3J16_16560 [Burkholderia sp. Ap-962]|nr:hypothetical protein [Burkholderia sp. Ap-962]